MNYKTRITQVMVLPEGQPIWSEMATTVSITDEAAGEFVEVSQSTRDGCRKIAFEKQEWPALRAAIEEMLSRCEPCEGDAA